MSHRAHKSSATPKRLFHQLLLSAPEPIEAILGVTAILCGIFIFLPFSVVSPPFEQLIQVIPEWVLGFIFCILGVWQLGFSQADYRRFGAQHRHAALMGLGQWAFAFYATLRTDWRALSLVVYFVFCCLWLWVLLRDPEPDNE